MTLDVAIRHRFKGFELDAAFRIAKPGVTALFGPSGAGKTTIANAIAGLFHPEGGRMVIDDRVVFDRNAGIDVPPRLRRIGYVFQDARLFPHLSVAGNLRYGWRRVEPRASDDEFARIVDMLGLEHLLARKPAKLSGGDVNVWGHGTARRDFTYAGDCANALLHIMQSVQGAVNLGSGWVHAIREIVDGLAAITGLADRVVWDTAKPDGQDHRAYDLSKLFATGFRPQVSLAEGLRRTYEWYAAEAATARR